MASLQRAGHYRLNSHTDLKYLIIFFGMKETGMARKEWKELQCRFFAPPGNGRAAGFLLEFQHSSIIDGNACFFIHVVGFDIAVIIGIDVVLVQQFVKIGTVFTSQFGGF